MSGFDPVNALVTLAACGQARPLLEGSKQGSGLEHLVGWVCGGLAVLAWCGPAAVQLPQSRLWVAAARAGLDSPLNPPLWAAESAVLLLLLWE